MAETIPHWLIKRAELTPNKLALEWGSIEYTFLELKDKSELFARKLYSIGVQKGSHVGILASNGVDLLIAVHALSFLGAVAVMLNIRLTSEELEYQIQDANVVLVITEDAHRNKVLMPKSLVKTFFELSDVSEADISLPQYLSLDQPFTMMYTSGTTGKPKAVVQTYGNHWWSAVGSLLNLGLKEQDKWLCCLPMFHIGGLSIFIRSTIYGIPVYLLEKFRDEDVNKALKEREITIVSIVTVMLERILEKLGEDTYPAHVRCFLLGGGSVPRSLLERAKEKQLPVFQSYGMTETASQIVTLSPEDALHKLGSSGKPLFPAELKIIEKDDHDVGEIIVRGPMVTKGYYNREEVNEETFTNGWLHTGDLGRVDEDGYLYVVDRRSDLIISGGENIYPAELESVLTRIPGVKEAGVCRVIDEKWGEVPGAFIVKSQESLREEEIMTYLKKVLASYKYPKYIFFIDSLPRNASNKLLRNVLAIEAKNRLEKL